jgi:hypothetical protein
MRRLSIVAVVFSLLGLGAASAIADTHVELHASLARSMGFPHAHGSSTFERNGSARDVDVTVSGIKGLAGHRVTVFVAGKKVGKMLVSAGGTAHRDFSTNDGQFVPHASAGSKVRVTTSGGALIASGTYHRDRDR